MLAPARYKAYTARRLVAGFGGEFDFDANVLRPGGTLPDFLAPLRERAGAWLGVPSGAFDHALVAQYPPGSRSVGIATCLTSRMSLACPSVPRRV